MIESSTARRRVVAGFDGSPAARAAVSLAVEPARCPVPVIAERALCEDDEQLVATAG